MLIAFKYLKGYHKEEGAAIGPRSWRAQDPRRCLARQTCLSGFRWNCSSGRMRGQDAWEAIHMRSERYENVVGQGMTCGWGGRGSEQAPCRKPRLSLALFPWIRHLLFPSVSFLTRNGRWGQSLSRGLVVGFRKVSFDRCLLCETWGDSLLNK